MSTTESKVGIETGHWAGLTPAIVEDIKKRWRSAPDLLLPCAASEDDNAAFHEAVRLIIDVENKAVWDAILDADMIWMPDGEGDSGFDSGDLNAYQLCAQPTAQRDPMLAALSAFWLARDYHWNEKIDFDPEIRKQMKSERVRLVQKYKTAEQYLTSVKIMGWCNEVSLGGLQGVFTRLTGSLH